VSSIRSGISDWKMVGAPHRKRKNFPFRENFSVTSRMADSDLAESSQSFYMAKPLLLEKSV
jgi:hypothetical protein